MNIGSGRIREIIEFVLSANNATDIKQLSPFIKLTALCQSLDLSFDEFDRLISENSPVLRTVKGHAFEAFFDLLMSNNGYVSSAVGGDSHIDRVVNGHTLQLKTPTMAGTKNGLIQFKTHKTHGPKSQQQSMSYYSKHSLFADFLVGLSSYNPLEILFLKNNELPAHSLSAQHILSPFSVSSVNHPSINAFERIGVFKLDPHLTPTLSNSELLPRTASIINQTSDVILNAILNAENFRCWDMAIRGFAREFVFDRLSAYSGVNLIDPTTTGRIRANKADHTVTNKNGSLDYLQMKGTSINNCNFDGLNTVLAVETQLTRGHVNDHPTQSRMYYCSDFDYLIIGLEPSQRILFEQQLNSEFSDFNWCFFAIPTSSLESHPNFPNRVKPVQKFLYKELKKFEINGISIKTMWD